MAHSLLRQTNEECDNSNDILWRVLRYGKQMKNVMIVLILMTSLAMETNEECEDIDTDDVFLAMASK
jgi:hypothetical protein